MQFANRSGRPLFVSLYVACSSIVMSRNLIKCPSFNYYCALFLQEILLRITQGWGHAGGGGAEEAVLHLPIAWQCVMMMKAMRYAVVHENKLGHLHLK